MKQDAIHRLGLEESLQQFAQRVGGRDADISRFRHSWALQGLRFLGVVPKEETWEKTVARLGDFQPRIAPGLAVPTKPPKLNTGRHQSFADDAIY